MADKEATPTNEENEAAPETPESKGDATEEQPKAAPKKRAAKKPAAKASGSKPRDSAKADDDGAAEEAEADSAPVEKPEKAEKRGPVVPRLKSRLEQVYANEVVPALLSDFGYENPMETPRPTKIVLNIGIGEVIGIAGRLNMDIVQRASDDLATITGQHPVVTKAKKSIANFKLRDGMPVGVTVTLRDLKMWQFLDRLVNIALPRVRDFHGVSRTSFDGRGTYALGLTEQIVLPEIDYNQIDRLRGLQVNIVTSARNDEEARRLLELLGMPFVRIEDRVPAAV